jgi:hypothetical protein
MLEGTRGRGNGARENDIGGGNQVRKSGLVASVKFDGLNVLVTLSQRLSGRKIVARCDNNDSASRRKGRQEDSQRTYDDVDILTSRKRSKGGTGDQSVRGGVSTGNYEMKGDVPCSEQNRLLPFPLLRQQRCEPLMLLLQFAALNQSGTVEGSFD